MPECISKGFVVEELLRDLNPSQQEAVKHVEGPLLVLAGPGSGKTRVITHRIAHMVIEKRIPPEQILAVTFTNKAAEEMRHRLEDLLNGRSVLACTFHSLCARLLRQFPERIGLTPRFTILDQRDRLKTVRRVMKEMKIDTTAYPPEAVDRRISTLKNELMEADDYATKPHDAFNAIVAKVFLEYQSQLKKNNSVDFDDLLMLFANLLRKDEEVRDRLNGRFRFVLVDEYQDTNLAQYAIAKGLSVRHSNLCATGDPDQSIYGWRGANLDNILNFEQDFPGAEVIRLEQNYRSTKFILRAADSLIKHNRNRKEKDLITNNPFGKKVRINRHQNESHEARFVVEQIERAVDSGKRRLRDFAIFVRTVQLTRPFETMMLSRGIPHRVIGGASFFERTEVRDIIAYARLAVNPLDNAAFERIINVPPRGIGDTTFDRLSEFARASGVSLAQACKHVDHIPGIRGKPKQALREFADLLQKLAEAAEMPADLAIETILELTKYRDYIKDEDEETQSSRESNVDGLKQEAQNLLTHRPEADLLQFLEIASLATDADARQSRSDYVTIMTLHAAKGLEFPVVYMVAFEDKILPHERVMKEDGRDFEEERRLAFVGLTRAREELNVTYTETRYMHGRTEYMTPSRFLQELPDEALDRWDLGKGSSFVATQDEDFDSQDSGYEEPSVQISEYTAPKSSTDRYRPGMTVQHPQHGKGIIIQVEGVGENRKAVIHFATAGTRRFVLSQATLELIRG